LSDAEAEGTDDARVKLLSTRRLTGHDIPDDHHRRAKAAAALEGLTLKDWLIQVLTQAVDDAPRRARRQG
jgi:hypothetical protein